MDEKPTPVRIKLNRVGGAQFEATNDAGHTVLIDGPEEVGGEDSGMRPMQVVLVGLAGCMAVDILHILQKGRRQVDDLGIEVEGWRADTVPAVYTRIHMSVTGAGDFDHERLQRAIDLSLEKYCSVARMLQPGVEVTAEGKLAD